MLITCAPYQIFDALPEEDTALGAKLANFLNAHPSNSTIVNISQFFDIYGELLRERGSSVLWFYGAAVCAFPSEVYISNILEQGSTLLGLVLLTLIRGFPRGKLRLDSVFSWLMERRQQIGGSGALSLVDSSLA
jgi:hypothetical protein